MQSQHRKNSDKNKKKMSNHGKIVVAMRGGIDSSIAAMMLHEDMGLR